MLCILCLSENKLEIVRLVVSTVVWGWGDYQRHFPPPQKKVLPASLCINNEYGVRTFSCNSVIHPQNCTWLRSFRHTSEFHTSVLRLLRCYVMLCYVMLLYVFYVVLCSPLFISLRSCHSFCCVSAVYVPQTHRYSSPHNSPSKPRQEVKL